MPTDISGLSYCKKFSPEFNALSGALSRRHYVFTMHDEILLAGDAARFRESDLSVSRGH